MSEPYLPPDPSTLPLTETFLVMSCSGPYQYEGEVVSHLNAGEALGTFFVNGNNCKHPFRLHGNVPV